MVEALVDFLPVDGGPPGGEVVGTLVLILQIIGVLPNVVPEDGMVALREGRVLVGGGSDFEFAAVPQEPAPAGAELLGCGLVELLLEGFEVAEVFADLLGDTACWLAAAAGLHDRPEHGVIDVAATIVAHGATNVFRNIIQIAKQVFSRVL